MILLEKFWPLLPEPGLLLWTTIIFLTFWFLVGKAAFKPIQAALKKRDDDIDTALKSAEQARAEMDNLVAKNEELLAQAREERTQILKEAKEVKDKIIEEAREKADADYRKKVASAVGEINNRKMEMMTEVKNEAGQMALTIAEKILKKELVGSKEHESFVANLVKDINKN